MIKRKKLLISSLAIALVGIIGVSLNGSASALEAWGPVRDTYTLESPAMEPVFNSITNNHNTGDGLSVGDGVSQMGPSVDCSDPNAACSSSTQIGLGDERNFVRIRKVGTNDFYTDLVNAVPGEEYEVYVYYHNNASPSLNDQVHNYAGWAYNTRLNIEYPEKVKKGQTAVIKGTISWNKTDDADAETFNVWDTTFIKASDEIYLRHDPNSVELHNACTEPTGGDPNKTYCAKGLFDADNVDGIFGTAGGFLSYYKESVAGTDMQGLIPACNEFAGYVTFRLVVDQPKFYLEKEVSLDGQTNWTDTIEAAPGDTLHFRIHYYNVGTTQQNNVNASDELPEQLIYETLADAVNDDNDFKLRWVSLATGATTPTVDTEITVGAKDFFGSLGYVVGNYEPNTEFYLYYDVKVADADSFEKCETDIWNHAMIATANGTMKDKVKVTVKKDCKVPDIIPETGPSVQQNAMIVTISICLGATVCLYTTYFVKRVNKK